MSTTVISVDVGGTKTLIGAFDEDGSLRAEWTQPTRGTDDDVEAMVDFLARCLARIDHPITAVAAGFPEYVTPRGQLSSAEVLRWRRQPAQVLREALPEGVAITIESDVRLGALGEATCGAGRGLASMLYVSLGTGLSSAWVVEGQVWPGARGEAIALGEHAVDGAANLEQFASGSGIAHRYLAGSGESVTGREVTARAAAGDLLAGKIVTSAGQALGDAIADIADVLDPQAVVLGGGLGAAATELTAVAQQVYERRHRRRPGPPPWVVATLGARSGLWGGAVAAHRSLPASRAR